MSDIAKALNLRENAKRTIGQSYTATDHLSNFFSVFMKLAIVFVILAINFLALSVALNCNINAPVPRKVGAALFAFFFGFIYLTLNYYSYRVLTLRKVCRMDKQRLFPFSI